MITVRTPLKEPPAATAAVTALPGDWPGPFLDDFPGLAMIVVAG
jgi:hypothetical protein